MKPITQLIGTVILLAMASSSAFAKTHQKAVHGKPLFKYPNTNPIYIITLTQEDLERMRQERLLKDLGRATYIKKTRHKAIPELN